MLRVLGIGDNVVDKYMHTKTMYPGGNALNFAVYAKTFGMEAGYLGVFGDDDASAHVRDTVRQIGVDLSFCRYYQGENGYAKVKLEDGDRVFIGSNKGGVSKQYPLKLTKLDEQYISSFDIVHTSIFSYIEDQLPILRRAAKFISMDFSNRATEDYYRKCAPYIDCACISCGSMPLDQVQQQMERIMSYGCRQMVIATRGAKGAVLLMGNKFYQQSPCLVKAVDTMGAGDSFITSFLVNFIDQMKGACDFPNDSGKEGITEYRTAQDLIVQISLCRAAVYSAENCQKDGSFGYGKLFK